MRQDFSNISADVFATLFPILLSEYDCSWKEQYMQEAVALCTLFGKKNIVRINHIGSTSVPGLTAKPTVDILLEVAPDMDIAAITEKMLDHGYVVNTPVNDVILYIKGYTPRGFEGQAFHIHVRYGGDWGELYFRDYLMKHPSVAAEYVQIKRKLKEQYPYDRDAYTNAKSEFICLHTEKARSEFVDRYRPNI